MHAIFDYKALRCFISISTPRLCAPPTKFRLLYSGMLMPRFLLAFIAEAGEAGRRLYTTARHVHRAL